MQTGYSIKERLNGYITWQPCCGLLTSICCTVFFAIRRVEFSIPFLFYVLLPTILLTAIYIPLFIALRKPLGLRFFLAKRSVRNVFIISILVLAVALLSMYLGTSHNAVGAMA